MKLTSKSLYSLHFLVALAVKVQEGEERPIHLREISEEHQIPFKFLEQLASLLKSVGLVKGSRGKSGGYQLAEPAEAISLARILRATEGELLPCAQIEGGNRTLHSHLQGLFLDLRTNLEKQLREINLADLAEKARSEVEPAYMFYL